MSAADDGESILKYATLFGSIASGKTGHHARFANTDVTSLD